MRLRTHVHVTDSSGFSGSHRLALLQQKGCECSCLASAVQVLQRESNSIYVDAHQSKPLCFSNDLIQPMIRFTRNIRDFCCSLNIGNQNEFTITKLVEKVVALTGSKSEISFEPLPTDDPRQRKPDITQARERYGWEPQVRLQEGLAKTAAYFEQLLISGELREE